MIPRFLLAKYVPELHRMEPRNIGVILWAKGVVAGKYLDPSEAAFVTDHERYNDWVTDWTDLASRAELASIKGKVVPKSDPAFLDALLAHQEGQYLLVDAGEVLVDVTKANHADALEFLFGDLVATNGRASTLNGLKSSCDRIIENAGLKERQDFHSRYPVQCEVFGVQRHFRCSYGLGNGTPAALFHRVVLSSSKSVDSAALMLHSFTNAGIVRKERTAALVEKSGEDREEEAFQLLSRITRVVDVSNAEQARQSLMEIASAIPIQVDH